MPSSTRYVWLVAALALLTAGFPVGLYSTHGSQEERDAAVSTEQMLDVAVSIRTISHVRIDEFGDSVWESGSGSGFLVSSEGCEVWTNQHVIEHAALVEVFPRGWGRANGVAARIVNSTPRSDLAILRMDSCEGIPAARLGDSSEVRAGDDTYAVGNPLGRNPDSISRGIISHTQRYVDGTTPYLQTDAAINPGSSGGALFNDRGEVIGINTALAASRNGSSIGIGYAVPINVARAVATRLHHGLPSWGDAGLTGRVSSLTPDKAAIFHVPDNRSAIIVTANAPDGPSADKLFAHDVIFEIAGLPVHDAAQAFRIISSHDAGAPVAFELVRRGELVAVEVTLGEGWSSGEQHEPDYYDGFLGMTLEMWNGRDVEVGHLETPVIAKVQSLGPAHRAYIASSQRTMGLRGPFVVAYQLDVKTISGVVFDGTYHSVGDTQSIERYARRAYEAEQPILLEIQHWTRDNPMDPSLALTHMGTAFFKVTPQRSRALSVRGERASPLHVAGR